MRAVLSHTVRAAASPAVRARSYRIEEEGESQVRKVTQLENERLVLQEDLCYRLWLRFALPNYICIFLAIKVVQLKISLLTRL